MRAESDVQEFVDGLTATDPLTVNELAAEAGLAWADAKLEAANLEANRKTEQERIKATLRAEYDATAPKPMSETAADNAVRSDPEYVAFLDDLNALAHKRDRLEVLHRTLHQRAALLARVAVEV